MKKAFYILIFLTFGFRCADKKDCHLENGKYEVVYDEEFSNHSTWQFHLEEDRLTELAADPNSEFKIEWISDGQFKVQPIEKRTEPQTEIEKQLQSLGEPFYEITDCKADTVKFVLYRNADIIINSGKIIRIE